MTSSNHCFFLQSTKIACANSEVKCHLISTVCESVRDIHWIFIHYALLVPIIVAARSKAWNVFVCWDRGFESHSRHGCLSAFILCCARSGLATDWFPVQGALPIVLILRNWSETKRFTDALCSKWEQQEKERDVLLFIVPIFKQTS
jgi:hypothetical protein